MAAFIKRITGLIDGAGSRRDRAARRTIAAAVAISILIHVAALWRMPPLRMPSAEFAEQQSGPLTVQLVPPPKPPSARARPPRVKPPTPPAPPRAPQPRAEQPVPAPAPPVRRAVPPAQRPPVLARADPGAPPAPAAQSAPPGDLASYVEAQRSARGDPAAAPPLARAMEAPPPSAPAAEDPNARANRLAAANLGLDRPPTFGPDPRQSGGVFQVTRMSYDYAEFMFFGWNRDIKRNSAQTIEVRKGAAPDIRIAVVRKMIGIIRDHEQGDFVWESRRLNRNLNLSARQRDNAGLEEFLMQEFFGPGR